MSDKNIFIILFFGAFLSAFLWNELNKRALISNGISLRNNATVITNDDVSYLAPFDNFREKGSLYDDELSKFRSVTRSPGYGSFYFACLFIFGNQNALYCLYLIQILFFSLSVYCLFRIAENSGFHRNIALFIVCIYGLLPFSMGFLNYTLTEGITPAFLIFGVYFFTKKHSSLNNQIFPSNYFWSSIVFSFLILVRPIMLIFLIPFIVLILINNRKNQLKNAIIFTGISLCLIGFWAIRNRIILNQWVSLHPIYQNEIPGIFRLPHQKAWDFFKGWEKSGAHFHETIVPFWEKTMSGDTNQEVLYQFINRIPREVIQTVGYAEIKNALVDYQRAILEQKPYYECHKIMPHKPLNSEIQAAKNFSLLAQKFQKNEPWVYYIKTPFQVFKTMIFHSNLSLFYFQISSRGNWFIELFRYICFSIHSISFLVFPIGISMYRKNRFVFLFGLSILLYLVYLAIIQRGIEERYTLPVLPFVLLMSGSVIQYLYLRLKSGFHC